MSQTFVFARNAPSAEYDRTLAWAALILSALGLVMVYSASIATAKSPRRSASSYGPVGSTRCVACTPTLLHSSISQVATYL